MPQKYADLLEPNTTPIIERIQAINTFIEAGYDVHVNFSPVIVTKTWMKDYEELFRLVEENVKYKDVVKAEVIFLTHNEQKHIYNIQHNLTGENMIWHPPIQEKKISQYGGENVRYKINYKQQWIKSFIKLHDEIIPWNKIRYIF